MPSASRTVRTPPGAASRHGSHSRRWPIGCGRPSTRRRGACSTAPRGDRKSTRLNSSHTEIYTLSLHDSLPISAGSRVAARLAFAPLADRLRTTVDEAARSVLDGAARRIADAAAEAAKQHAQRDDVPLVALGGSGDVLVARVAELLGRPVVRTEHPEVLSSIGAALSLVRVELDRNGVSALDVPALAIEAEAACIAAGAAPASITGETAYDEADRILRAVATE